MLGYVIDLRQPGHNSLRPLTNAPGVCLKTSHLPVTNQSINKIF